MADVIRFPPRLRAIQPLTAEQIEVRDALITALGEGGLCPSCKGRGIFSYKGKMSAVIFAPCPCGGDDENRIDLDEPEYPGVA